MINWFKKLYKEGPWGFWAIMFLFPIPLFSVFIEVLVLNLDFEINYGWFFAPFVFCAFMHERKKRKKK